MGRIIKKDSNSFAKVSKYLPVFIILLSLTIILGSTFAYFTDKVERTSDLTFSKIELSSETTTGINGTIKDVIPGTPLVNGMLKFSKSIDSEAIYVRAKISFSLPNEYKDDNDMISMLDLLRTATDFNIVSEEQNGAVWSAKVGNYFYLVENADTTKLMRVDTIDTYVLSNEIVVPRDLTSLPDNAQYMKSINFHVAFEAIQADNVSNVLNETKVTFNDLFPENESEKVAVEYQVTFKSFDGSSDLEIVAVKDGDVLSEPVVNIPLDVNNEPLYVIDGWYSDSGFNNKYEFGGVVEDGLTLYPKVLEVSQGLTFTEIKDNNVVVGYSVAKGGCSDTFVVVPDIYKGLPVTSVAENGFNTFTALQGIYLPSSITSIDSWGFYACKNLVLTELSDVIINIGMAAFQGCEKLALTSLPSGLTIINSYAFRDCTNLALTELPNGITSIGSYAFFNCPSLALTKLPDELININNDVFYKCNNLVSILIQGKLKNIDRYAFENCTSLKMVFIPSSVTTIGGSAFSGAVNLEFILCETTAVANLAKSKGRDNNYIYSLQESGYEGGSFDTEVVISEDLTIYTATINGVKWARTSDNKYFRCIA